MTASVVDRHPDLTAPDLRERVWAALGTVRDPELDESITDLTFVSEVGVLGGDVAVTLRLPTYFCAPNFAYLMVADAYDAVAAIPGVETVKIELLDHFASAEINAGVAERAGFSAAFAGQADDELERAAADVPAQGLSGEPGTGLQNCCSTRTGKSPNCMRPNCSTCPTDRSGQRCCAAGTTWECRRCPTTT